MQPYLQEELISVKILFWTRVIIIHELAHKVLAPGMDNRPIIENSEANTKLVLQHCQAAIDYWGFVLNK
jgi:hypothetical protein